MLDLLQVRHAYFHPPPDDPGRPVTREELHALRERRRVEGCLMRGGDPREEGLGEHGSLIGGPDKPLTLFGSQPERAGRIHPLPLAWFDHPRGRERVPLYRDVERAHSFFAMLAGDHLAGMPERPSGRQLASLFRASSLSGREKSQVWHVFACIRRADLRGLRTKGGLSVYEIARAMLLAETRRAWVIRWTYQYALDPDSGTR